MTQERLSTFSAVAPTVVQQNAVPRAPPLFVHGQQRVDWVQAYLPPVHAVWPGNACELFPGGEVAFPAMLKDIAGAKKTVRLETYMFFDDEVGQKFSRALSAAAQRGVEVTALYDALGSWTIPRRFYRQMRDQGVKIRAFGVPRWASAIHRDHRKLLVVDGEVAYVGGINIAENWAPPEGKGWRDDAMRIEGPAVAELERTFFATWRMAVRERLAAISKRARPVPQGLAAKGDVKLAVVSSRRGIHNAYLYAIERATQSILIEAAYFVPQGKLVRALRRAAARGVEVSLILNGHSDHRWLHFATRAYYDRLMASGVRIYEWCRGTLHAKTAVIDGVWATIGSFNLERTSLRLNHEVNVLIADERLGKAFEDSFRRDASMCQAIDPHIWSKRPLWQRLAERFLYLFRRLI